MTISNIQSRLKNKDYRIDQKVKNPLSVHKKDMAGAFRHISLAMKSHKTEVNNNRSRSAIFRQTSMFSNSNEYATFGIDDPDNLNIVLQEAIGYFNGTYSPSQVTSALTNLNGYLLNFPMNQTGVEQLLAEGVTSGSLTIEQRTIIEAELGNCPCQFYWRDYEYRQCN